MKCVHCWTALRKSKTLNINLYKTTKKDRYSVIGAAVFSSVLLIHESFDVVFGHR